MTTPDSGSGTPLTVDPISGAACPWLRPAVLAPVIPVSTDTSPPIPNPPGYDSALAKLTREMEHLQKELAQLRTPEQPSQPSMPSVPVDNTTRSQVAPPTLPPESSPDKYEDGQEFYEIEFHRQPAEKPWNQPLGKELLTKPSRKNTRGKKPCPT